MLKNKKVLYVGGGILILIIGYFLFGGTNTNEISKSMIVAVQKGDLPIEVIATGELEAKNSQKIFAPTFLRSLGVSQIKISEMVDEGTILKEGDFVASLDPSEIGSKLNQLLIDMDQKLSDLKTAKLDTTLSMRTERENILNLKYAMEESDLEVKQSKFEPPAVQRKAEINLDKAKRNYRQAVENLKVKKQQAMSKVFKVQTDVKQLEVKLQKMQKGMESLVITAPQNGMLVYYSSWNGKVKPGSTINTWNPVIASIPDLSGMISKTFVNEIDISKVAKGQQVEIAVDAFADKKITGEITSVANIGQKMSGSDAKVFEVIIKINQSDSMLRPSMTTSNRIKIKELKEVNFVPIETIFNQDSIQYVFLQDGGSFLKKEVETGESTEEFIVIKKGIKDGDKVSLIAPEEEENITLTRMNKND